MTITLTALEFFSIILFTMGLSLLTGVLLGQVQFSPKRNSMVGTQMKDTKTKPNFISQMLKG